MKILTIHADYIEFKPLQKALKSAEDVEREKRRVEECLVVFSAVEKADEAAPEMVAKECVSEISSIAQQVGTKRVVLYPWVHLSSKPSSPSCALLVLKKTEEMLGEKGYEVERAPFGWYKAFEIKCKGHPLSELSREIVPKKESGEKLEVSGEPISESLKREAEVKSSFYILTPDGGLVEADKFGFSHDTKNLERFLNYEMKKVRGYEKEPPHIRLMKEQKIADYESGSDGGNFRWYPKGKLVKKLLERQITDYCIGYGAMEVETPVMYDYEHPALKKYLNRFPARQYVVMSDEKECFLRFSACFGQFLMAHGMVISYKDLPMRMYELTRYSFRREQSGELAGLKRLRAFTMPDMHTMCGDIEQAKVEFQKQFEKALEWINQFNLDYEVGFRAERNFYEKNKDWYKEMVKRFGRPVLMEIFDERYAYFITKFEFNYIDNMEKASALSTVQIDVENAETYDIKYVDKDGKERRPIILHASISGSVERVIYALLEQQAKRISEGKPPMFPLWLSPIQVRVLPVTDSNVGFAKDVAEQLVLNQIRVDVDDGSETLSKKIRKAEHEWIPFIVVVGKKEEDEKILSVRIRGSKETREMAIEELITIIRNKTKGYPFEPLSLPMFLSKRPIFRG